MSESKKQKFVEKRLVKLGKAIRLKREDNLGYVGLDDFLDDIDKIIYRGVMLKSSGEQYVYVKERYWKDKKGSHDEIMDKIGVSRPTYFSLRKSLLEDLFAELEKGDYIRESELR